MIGKYERGEADPLLKQQRKLPMHWKCLLDNLVGEGIYKGFDKKTLQRFKDLEHLEDEKKKLYST